ncbi:MAG: 4Fe-4S cluster-binding domain-containing protein [Candidatus Latescibacterota bacterium]|nr:MAG: 4Fe-4S cluster-binding domain-containing protein [Candidatus Latescibacterota bacterium]
MIITGLHLLWSYKCIYECDHCFTWGSPRQEGTFTLGQLENILNQAEDLGTIEWFYFEGGEPFLYYATLLRAVERVHHRGFNCGIVSNAYWATSEEDAMETLRPFADYVDDLSLSSDLYHSERVMDEQIQNATWAAEKLGIPAGTITIAQPEAAAGQAIGQLPMGEIGVMYRGRAVEKLVDRAGRKPWDSFTKCPHEELRDPGRVHIDPLGNVHLCQGLSIGSLFTTPLEKIIDTYEPDEHPILGPLLEGGPAELVRRYDLPHDDGYADACHLCFDARGKLRERFPGILTPEQMYGEPNNG